MWFVLLVMSYHAMSCHVMSCHVVSCRVVMCVQLLREKGVTYFRELRGELGAFEDRNGVTAEPDHIVYLVSARKRENEREGERGRERRDTHRDTYIEGIT